LGFKPGTDKDGNAKTAASYVDDLLVGNAGALSALLSAVKDGSPVNIANAALGLMKLGIPLDGKTATLGGYIASALNVSAKDFGDMLSYGGAGLAVVSALQNPTPQNIVNASANDGDWRMAA